MKRALCLSLPASMVAFEFLSIGDWGDSDAKTLTGYMSGDLVDAPEWVLGIGDNFYSDGVKSVDDPQFKDKFEDTFTEDKLQVPWYLTSGNHDYYGGVSGVEAEIQYTQRSTRWKFPALYFDKLLTSRDNVTVHLLSVDTWRLNGGDTYVQHDVHSGKSFLRNESHVRHSYKTGVMEKKKHDVLLKMFKEPEAGEYVNFNADQEQLDWIAATLATSEADWKIVMGHFPIYSSTTGEHGDTANLIQFLLPILKDNEVDVYFNGHDHVLQHIFKDDIHFLGSGAGAQKHKGINTTYPGLMGYHQGHFGFMIHDVSRTELKTSFVDDTGAVPYEYTIKK